MTKSAQELEREVELARGEVDRTADAIKDRMTPGQLVDEFMRSLRDSEGSTMLSNLGTQVRDNPLPLMMVGAGLAWLMLGSGVRYRHHEEYREPWQYGTGTTVASGSGPFATHRGRGKASELGSRATGAMKSAAAGVADAASSAGRAISSATSRTTHAAGDFGSGAGSTGRHAANYGRRMRRTVSDILHEEPLVVGALGVAIGAAIGAMLPSSDTEDRYLGPARDRALGEGRAMARERFEEGKDIAGAAYAGARTEAEKKQGPSSYGSTMTETSEPLPGVDTESTGDVARDKSTY